MADLTTKIYVRGLRVNLVKIFVQYFVGSSKSSTFASSLKQHQTKEDWQSDRMRWTRNPVYPLLGIGGLNPSSSAKLFSIQKNPQRVILNSCGFIFLLLQVCNFTTAANICLLQSQPWHRSRLQQCPDDRLGRQHRRQQRCQEGWCSQYQEPP